jgi:hypothetical protein
VDSNNTLLVGSFPKEHPDIKSFISSYVDSFISFIVCFSVVNMTTLGIADTIFVLGATILFFFNFINALHGRLGGDCLNW